MPRAVDPSLFGQQLPIDHSPLNRMEYRVRRDEFDLDAIMEQMQNFITQVLFPTIENMFGIDLSALLSLVELIDFDFSSPAAFFQSLINILADLPDILGQIIVMIVNTLINLPHTIRDLLEGLIEQLSALTGIDLTIFLPLLDLLNIDLSSPTAFLFSLMTAILSIPSIVVDIVTGILEQITEFTGIDLSIFLPILNLLDFDFSSPAAFLASITTSIMAIPEVFIDFINGFVDMIINLPETLTMLVTNLIALLSTLPETIIELLSSLIFSLADMTGIDLTVFLPILDLLNFDFSSPEAFVASLTTAIMTLPDVFMDFIGGFITLLGTNPDAMADMLNNLISTLAELPAMLGDLLQSLITLLVSTPDILMALLDSLMTLLFSAPDIIMSLAQTLISTGVGFLGVDSPINAFNIFGTLRETVFGSVPIGSLTDFVANLIPLGGMFPTGSIATGSGWISDLLTAATSGGSSAKVTANGQTQGLRGTLIPVTPGQTLNLSVMTKWSGLTSLAGSSPIQFGLVAFNHGAEVFRALLGSIASPGAASSGWQTISGSYTVPDIGVDGIKLRLGLTGAATAGSVWFTNVTGNLPGMLQQDWVTNLPEQFQGILDMFGLGSLGDLILPAVEDLWTNLFGTILNPLGIIEDLFARFDIQNIIDTIIHAVEGIPVFGGTIAEMLTAVEEIFGTALDGQAMGTDALGQISDLLADLLAIPSQIIGTLAQTNVGGLVSDLADRLRISGTNGSTDYWQNLLGGFRGTTSPGTGATATTLRLDFHTMLETLVDRPVTGWTSLDLRATQLTQTMTILSNGVVTAIDGLIQNIKNWWGAEDWAWW